MTRYEFLTAIWLKIQVFWGVATCRSVNCFRLFEGSYGYLLQNEVVKILVSDVHMHINLRYSHSKFKNIYWILWFSCPNLFCVTFVFKDVLSFQIYSPLNNRNISSVIYCSYWFAYCASFYLHHCSAGKKERDLMQKTRCSKSFANKYTLWKWKLGNCLLLGIRLVSDINFWRFRTAAFSEEIKMCPLAVPSLSVHMSTYINTWNAERIFMELSIADFIKILLHSNFG